MPIRLTFLLLLLASPAMAQAPPSDVDAKLAALRAEIGVVAKALDMLNVQLVAITKVKDSKEIPEAVATARAAWFKEQEEKAQLKKALAEASSKAEATSKENADLKTRLEALEKRLNEKGEIDAPKSK